MFISLLQSCTYPFHPDIEIRDTRILVVESLITDETGPFQVKLTHSFEVNNMQLIGEPVTGADIMISDDKGNSYPLYYTNNGIYETEDTLLNGIVGNIYTLHISTTEGDQFESSPVLMKDVPDIDSLYFKEVTRPVLANDEIIEEKWLDICLDAHDPSGQTKYWKWEFEETWEVRTPKDSIKLELTPGNIICVNVEFIEGNPQKGWDNKKERCWIHKPSASIEVESTTELIEDRIYCYALQSIPPKNDRLDIKYSILVQQIALNNDLFHYFKNLKDFNEQQGSMFDNIPEQVIGNIYCCNGNKKALGYFNASAARRKRLTILPLEHDVETKDPYEDCIYNLPKQLIINYYLGHIVEVADSNSNGLIGTKAVSYEPWCPDCRMYGTNVMPDYWEEEE